jgi:hypothetical protein
MFILSMSDSDTETRYAQIEKELLSVIFGLERFHQYTYGRTVQVRSDHKPLESILKKLCSKFQLCTFLFLVYIEDVCHISATVATYAVIVSVLHEAVSSELILAVCDLTCIRLMMNKCKN